MKLRFPEQTKTPKITTSGGNLTIPLYMTGTPTIGLHCIPKSYVDTLFASRPASAFTSGTISSGSLPSFTGDLTKSGTTLTLNNINASTIIKPKVTVDSKGRITAGADLLESDIPTISFSKITTGKPTTLTGYGITDAIPNTGGTVTNFITATSQPTNATHAATKTYVDSFSGSSGSLVVGSMIKRTSSTTPTGYLKCNGGEVSQATYNALYDVIGNTYNETVLIGAGQPWRQQYDINTEQSTDITGWVNSGYTLPGANYDFQVIVTKNRLHIFGGTNATTFNGIRSVAINSDGTLGTWTSNTILPNSLCQSQAIVVKNKVYLLGGNRSGNAVPDVYSAPINTDGTLGVWATNTNLPGPLAYSQAIVTKDRVYLIGGTTTIAVNTVYTAVINSDGSLGTWATASVSLPAILRNSQAFVIKNKVYLASGINSGTTALSVVYSSTIASDGTLGTWVTETSLPGGLYSSHSVCTRSRVYLIGGNNGKGSVTTVYTAPINADGTLGTWTSGTSLPTAVRLGQLAIVKNKIYLLGGRDNSAAVSTIYVASFSGGLNDYSRYYDGTIFPTTVGYFNLPDFTNKEVAGTYTYIKY